MGKEIKVAGSCLALVVMMGATVHSSAATLVRFEAVPGELAGPGGTENWIEADEFSLGIEREFEPTPGTEDINIGVGELQECTISKSMDSASPFLARFAINGNSLGMCEICLTTDATVKGKSPCYAHYVLDRCFVMNMHVESPESDEGGTEDVLVEQLTLYFNKIAYGFQTSGNHMTWDNVHNVEWPEGVDFLFNFDPAQP